MEIMLAVFIAAMIVTLAVPSVSGVLAEQRMKRSFDAFNRLVRDAQRLSLKNRQSYRILWEQNRLLMEPADVGNLPTDVDPESVQLDIEEDETFAISLPAALIENPPAEWTFWPNGTCEPAVITYHGSNGDWQAVYDPLTCTAVFSTDLSE